MKEKIWLQVDEDGSFMDETTWCEDKINNSDIEYIRADSIPSLDNLEVVEKCKECKGGNISPNGYCVCPHCQGTGKVTRAATWDEVNPILIQAISGFQIQGKYFHTKDGGILRVKGE